MIYAEDQIRQLVENQKKVLSMLQEARKSEFKCFLAHQGANDELNRYTRDKIINFIGDPNFSTLDPRTGEHSDEWAKWLIDRQLEQDEGFVGCMAEVHKTQEEYLQSKTATQNLKDELYSINVRLELIKEVHG